MQRGAELDRASRELTAARERVERSVTGKDQTYSGSTIVSLNGKPIRTHRCELSVAVSFFPFRSRKPN